MNAPLHRAKFGKNFSDNYDRIFGTPLESNFPCDTDSSDVTELRRQLTRYKEEVHRLRGRLSHYETLPIFNED